MVSVHPTAVVSSKAQLGENVVVDKYAIINDDVIIGDESYIGPFAVVYDGARIGKRVKIMQSASVANIPQDLGFRFEESVFEIGDDTVIREFVTLHRGTKATGKSVVGKNCFLMAYSHVAHDCVLGDNIIMANSVQLAGHVHIQDSAVIGGGTVVHQFCTIGRNVMIGGGHKVVQDVPPFITAAEWPLQFKGVNLIGLRRKGFAANDIQTIKKAYTFLYDNSLNVSQAKEKIELELGDNDYVKMILEFLASSKRGIIGK